MRLTPCPSARWRVPDGFSLLEAVMAASLLLLTVTTVTITVLGVSAPALVWREHGSRPSPASGVGAPSHAAILCRVLSAGRRRTG